MRRVIALSLLCALLFTGCRSASAELSAQTPEDTIHTAFTALKELDMDTFNACTNNKMAGGYRMLSDLFTGSDKETFQQMAQIVVKDLSWEIHSVTIENGTALADVTIHNKDYSDAVGMFVTGLIQDINQSQKNEVDFSALIRTTIKKAKSDPEAMLPYLENCQKEFSTDMTITLKETDNGWQIQLDDSLCNQLTGYLNTENLSDHMTAKINAVEELLNHNMERWGVEVKSGQWIEQLTDMFK